MLPCKADEPRFDSQKLNKGRTREPTSQACPHMYTHAHKRNLLTYKKKKTTWHPVDLKTERTIFNVCYEASNQTEKI